MSKSVIVTEKPSVARTFAKTLGVSSKFTGYFENDNWIITWCLGHLVTMSYPEVYSEDLRQWSYDTLPFLPDEYLYEVIDDNKEQFAVIRSLYNRSDIDTIYYAGDAAREGLYIQMLVRQLAGTKKGITERVVWIDSQTDAEIKRGIKEAKALSSYSNLSDAGYLRAIEDYAVGINLTRAFSLKFCKALNLRKPVAVGRVMTCVLSMIVDREREIRNFKPEDFYKISATSVTMDQNVFMWKSNKDSKIYEKIRPYLYDESGFSKEQPARSFMGGLGKNLIIKSIESKTEKKYAPLLYNLAELQNDCSKRFKLSPDKTLEILEKLYMAGLITYPRTDARVLSSAVADEIQANLNGIARIDGNAEYIKAISNPTGIKKSRYVDDSKIADHYALIPTGQALSALNSLTPIERGVYDLIEKRFISIFMPPAVYEKTSVTAVDDLRGEYFYLTGSVLKEEGYTKALGKQAEDAFTLPFKEGDVIPVKYDIVKGETKPKPRYTSGSIILAMENAGKLIEDETLREQIKGQGIGTSATRAEILKKLVSIGDITLNSKTQVLQPTDLGELVIDIVRSNIPEMCVPEMTAKWETELDAVAKGELSRDKYQDKIDGYVAECVKIIKSASINESLKTSASKVSGGNDDKKAYTVKAADVETYINVPFEDKDKVKLFGARFDSVKKMWYVPKGMSLANFAPYLFEGKCTSIKKVYLFVPYDDKDEAKSLGARWDNDKKQWYITNTHDKNKFSKWLK